MIKLLDPADEVFDFKEIFTGELKPIFKPAGCLQSALELEHRPEQEKMARRVGSALAAKEPLLFEAGTGVGKSLAYLLPTRFRHCSPRLPDFGGLSMSVPCNPARDIRHKTLWPYPAWRAPRQDPA